MNCDREPVETIVDAFRVKKTRLYQSGETDEEAMTLLSAIEALKAAISERFHKDVMIGDVLISPKTLQRWT